MTDGLKELLRDILARAGVGVTSINNMRALQAKKLVADRLGVLDGMADERKIKALQHISDAKSQLGQDLFVLSELGFKSNGFFVEFGATNGLDLSNTFLLEKQFGWSGILAEPAKRWHAELKSNRQCKIETSCVWSKSGEKLPFIETAVGELSTIGSFAEKDGHVRSGNSTRKYYVDTISLLDLLDRHKAPRLVDYLSIDTEGSEYEILSEFDFSKYKFSVITCEHNFTQAREAIFKLLTANGYRRKFEDASKFDDWYVLE